MAVSRWIGFASLTFVLAFGAAVPAKADLIIGNYTPYWTAGAATSIDLRLAVEFKVGDSPQWLDSATFELSIRLGAHVTATLRTTNDADPNTPGALLATLNSTAVGMDRIDSLPITFTATTPILLQAQTSYWLQLSVTGGDFGWASDRGLPTGPGATFLRTYYSNPFFTGALDGFVPLFRLDSPVVPEPSSIALAGIAGVVGLAVAKLRRNSVRS
ncbi:choice-of-anchor R domain-containing protein [Paludisphaera rhizosphaerae]|uniref:choice-of-anchor R domain-containing protein n=1 Tax=Paludisphaera rhizosphaerae TaxID=2711216 RepID=UPI0013EB8722|nr:choice-of-anchor R domain-containing protein [Paludisphaera rhizosphaerae]